MNRKIFFLLYLAVSLAPYPSYADKLLNGTWIDLTHGFSEETIYWPTADSFQKTKVYEGYTEGGYYYAANNFSAAEHGGTHVDAPIHFYENRHTVDQIPVDQLIGPGVVIRVVEKVEANRNYQFSVQDILDWEKEHGVIPEDSILLIHTGSGKLWPDKEKYMGTRERGEEAVARLHFPGIHPDAARFLVEKRKIKAIGLDSPSLDYGGSKLFETHQILFENNIPGLENVANLDKLPVTGFTIVALPMKIKGGSGGPVRIVAYLPDK